MMNTYWQQNIQKHYQKNAAQFETLKDDHHPVDESFASVAVILLEGDKGPSLLFIKRQDNPQDPWSGHIAFPGGRAENHEGPIETARRESLEEVGLSLGPADMILSPAEARARSSMGSFLIYPCLFTTDFRWSDISQTMDLCPTEVKSVHCFSLTELLAPRNQSVIHWNIEQKNIELPSLQIGRHTIWGLTYWILEKFLYGLEGLHIGPGKVVDLREWRAHPKI